MRLVARGDPPTGPWTAQELAAPSRGVTGAADTATGLASLSFITAAIRRRKRAWCLAAVLGLIVGVGLFLVHPPAYTATTRAFLTLGPNEDLTTAVDTEVALAQSRPVAALALRKLGEQDSADSLLGNYTATSVTNRVVEIAVKAKSDTEAVRRANAVMTAYLDFRAAQLRAYQQLLSASLSQEVSQASTRAATLSRQLDALTANPAIAPQSARINNLRSLLRQANDALSAAEQAARNGQQTARAATAVAVTDSKIIDKATLVSKSRKKAAVEYALVGMFGGLVFGLLFVVVGALVSDRLRWRDDIAYALGAPVKLSISPVHLRPGRRGLAAVANPGIQAMADHLRRSLPAGGRPAALAVVPVDKTEAAALSIIGLALSCAKARKRVIVADLCPGMPAARILGAASPGFHPLEVEGSHLALVVPEPSEVPIGPLPVSGTGDESVAPPAKLAAACSSADLVLTLAALDPMTGGEHLVTWATDAVVIVTAGQLTWTRVEAVGEMIRLAGVRLESAVVVGADKSDESLGRMRPARAGQPGGSAVAPGADGVFATVNGTSGGTSPRDK